MCYLMSARTISKFPYRISCYFHDALIFYIWYMVLVVGKALLLPQKVLILGYVQTCSLSHCVLTAIGYEVSLVTA